MSVHSQALFPEDMSYGSVFGPSQRSIVVESDSGFEVRSNRWGSGTTRVVSSVAEEDRTAGELATLLSFWRCRRGASCGFRFRNWMDFSTSDNHVTGTVDEGDRVLLGTGDSSETVFQLRKSYVSGGVTVYKTISKPIPPGWPDHSIVVLVNDVEMTEGTDWTCDYNTGQIRFAVAPAAGYLVEAAFTFHTLVRCTDEFDGRFEAELLPGNSLFSLNTAGVAELVGADVESSEENLMGGHSIITASGSEPTQLNFRDGLFQELTGHSSGWNYKLPDMSIYPYGGGAWLRISNIGANSLDIIDYSDAAVTTIAAGYSTELVLESDNATWVTR